MLHTSRSPLIRSRYRWIGFYSWVLFCAFFLPSQLLGQSFEWHRALKGAFHSVAFNPLSHGKILFAGPYDSSGIYRSDDAGLTWKHYVQGLDPFFTDDFHEILCVPSDTSVVIAVATTALFRSTDGGMTWNTVEGLGGINGEDIAYQSLGDVIYYGKNYAGPTLKSVDHGANWLQTGPADTSVDLCTIAVSPDDPPILLAGSGSGAIARSVDEGNSWQQTFNTDSGSSGLEVPKIVYSDYATNALSEHHTAIATRWISQGRGLVATTDAGANWTVLPYPFNTVWALDLDQRRTMLTANGLMPSHFWIGLFRDRSDTLLNGLVQETTDAGQSWHTTNFPKGQLNDPGNPVTSDVWVLKFDTTSATLAAATGTGIYLGSSASGVAETIPISPIRCSFTQGMLRVSSPETIASFEVYDEIGRRLMHRAVQKNKYATGILNYPHGNYVVRVMLASGYIGTFKLAM